MTEIQRRLFELQDEKYGEFQRKLMPTVAPESVIGVRTPQLRALAKEIYGSPEAEGFLREELPHKYYEENNLHAMLIEQIKDYELCVEALDRFLPYVDNWATCDTMFPKALGRRLPELLEKIKLWTASGETYTIRFGIGMLMRFYLDGNFNGEILELVSGVRSEEYYVNMMRAWFFATALAKQYEAALAYLEKEKLDAWTHNKTIRKAIESYRISDEQKAYLRTLKMEEQR